MAVARAIHLLAAAIAAVAAAPAAKAAPASAAEQTTDRPIIGVLTTPVLSAGCVTAAQAAQELQGRAHEGPRRLASGGSCFHSLYVQWLESAGARVVPLLYDLPAAELDRLLDSVNGVLFTGGETALSDLDSPYMRAAGRLLERALETNKAGVHLPVWGTCMGFQTLSVLVAQRAGVLDLGAFDSESLMLPLDLSAPDIVIESRLLGALGRDVLQWLTTENVTVNLHHDGLTPEAFQLDAKLASFFRVVSTNRDRKGRAFVSTIEGRAAPVFGVQWHPERPQFQFSSSAGEGGINHSPHAIQAMQAVANFFVGEARRNGRHFASAQEEATRLIYRYTPSGPLGDAYRAYIFPPASSAVEASGDAPPAVLLL